MIMDNDSHKKSYYGKRPLWQWIGIYAVIAVVVYGLVYYLFLGKNNGYMTGQGGGYPTTAAQNQTGSQNPSSSVNTMQIAVTGNEFAFSPSEITVKSGQPMQITFKNMGKYPHDLSISELGVRTAVLDPGQQETLTFTPDKTGTFTYMCTVPGHADKGMKGTLIVQ